jgi:diadenosine tetraphosphate (Ap4A) HIT family hydrolase
MELWVSVKNLSENLKRYYNTESINIFIQDGEDAGQTLDHLVVHLIPVNKKQNIENIDEMGKINII